MKYKQIDLQKLLLTGNSEITIGMHINEIEEIFGKPKEKFVDSKKLTSVFKYGSLQIFFKDDVVNYYGLYFLSKDAKYLLPSLDGVPSVTNKTYLHEFIYFLHLLKLTWNVNYESTYLDQVCLHVNSNILVYYNIETGELDKILAYSPN